MNYTLHQLRVFLKVVDCLSITKASKELFLTQPAVSIQLKKLQDQFDLPLTEVIGKQLYITDFGQKIAETSRRILEESDKIRYTVDQFKGLLSGKIKISVVSTGKYVIPYFIKSFIDKYPGVEISIDVSNKTKVVESLVKNESDFSLVSVPPEKVPIHSIELMDNRLYLVGSRLHTGPIKSLKDLKESTLLFREEGSATRLAMQRILNKQNVTTGKTMELVSNEAVKQAINAGIGFSIVPLIGLRNELANGSIKIFPIKGLPIKTKWNLVYRKGKKLTPAHEEFIRHIDEEKLKIVDEYFSWATGEPYPNE